VGFEHLLAGPDARREGDSTARSEQQEFEPAVKSIKVMLT
jgi:hypothetical protein